MSRAPHEATNAPGAGSHEGDQYPQNQASHAVSHFVDGSGPIFSMHMEMAMEEDKKMAENWKADADGILIFEPLHFFRWLRRSVATYLSPIFSTTFPSEDIIRRRWLPLLPAHVVHDYLLHLIRPLLSKGRGVQWKEALLAPLRRFGKYYDFHGSSTNVTVTVFGY
ncbi:hypothetical protein H4582DRAFT_2085156 [Lactarius indigo]|nr:hypothetical protein H4582DRAFT_2085156 [Lactarius indigo]